MRLEPRKGLADICRRLAALPEDDKEAQRLGNHYHYVPWMNNADDDSMAFTILIAQRLQTDSAFDFAVIV